MVSHRLVELAVMVGQVPFSTSLWVATRHVASERLDLFLHDTLGLGSQIPLLRQREWAKRTP